jgi:hypothetical protein
VPVRINFPLTTADNALFSILQDGLKPEVIDVTSVTGRDICAIPNANWGLRSYQFEPTNQHMQYLPYSSRQLPYSFAQNGDLNLVPGSNAFHARRADSSQPGIMQWYQILLHYSISSSDVVFNENQLKCSVKVHSHFVRSKSYTRTTQMRRNQTCPRRR